ncbi:MAG: hypothetical protein EZS28_025934 [Streblomastix strix]|uniref:Pre-rRNA-processing protein TSR2 n=1 Tax=Streblomastix strix TaxID=222440 RepID=A0A5J4V6W2_9EUKA|nr:MAG: hypothetical protein EZS28_025934 [Streblomastix strix]
MSHPTRKQLESFLSLGIKCVLNTWDALVIAIRDNFSQDGEDEKRLEFLLSDLIENLYKNKNILTLLESYMQDDFNCTLEDGSLEQVSDQIDDIFDNLKTGNISEVIKVAKLACDLHAIPLTASLSWKREDFEALGSGIDSNLIRLFEGIQKRNIQEDDEEEDDEEEDDEEEDDENQQNEEIDNKEIKDNEQKKDEKENIEEKDDDGFQLYTGKRKGRK